MSYAHPQCMSYPDLSELQRRSEQRKKELQKAERPRLHFSDASKSLPRLHHEDCVRGLGDKRMKLPRRLP